MAPVTTASNTEHGKTSSTDPPGNHSHLLEWSQLVGLSDLDLKTDQLQPFHWLAHPCPKELKVTSESTPPEITAIVHQSLAADLYKKKTASSKDGTSDTGPSGDRRSIMSDLPDRPKNGSASQLSRLSSVTNSDGSRSPSKRSMDSSSIKRPLGWIASKTTNPTKGLKERLRERNTFKECSSCFNDVLDKNMLGLKCQHKYCLKCFLKLVDIAMKEENLFPPKCCLEKIPQQLILDNLDHSRREKYKLKIQEYSMNPENRWYCPAANCNKWIPPNKVKKGSKPDEKICPHCRASLCALCRRVAHRSETECPRDYGLEATLKEAENYGWRRCYNCHSMVELMTGCRHITCKCGAQFCYTCGTKWRECDCTEEDQRIRQHQIETRRQQSSQQALQALREEEEIAAALAEIDRMEREEALERERSAEEQRRREEEEARDKEMKRMMYIAERVQNLRAALANINRSQQCMLNERHEKAAIDLHDKTMAGPSTFEQKREALMADLKANQKQRLDRLEASQMEELHTMTARHEEEEDDTFLTISRHLKGKPNRECRERSIIDKLKASQETELCALEQLHQAAKHELEQNNQLEVKALEAGLLRDLHSSREADMDTVFKLSKMVIIDRCWFSAVVEKRWEMLDQYRARLIDTGADIEEMPGVRVVGRSVELPADTEFAVVSANAEAIPDATTTPVPATPALASPGALGASTSPAAAPPAAPKHKHTFSKLAHQSPFMLLG
ncbi:hypothetical protein AJ79_03570 [Helicocarpus griseus UAMH5409]|uniref:RBR-type E3 ubiquitin transferase n=1 Tax=Helicocarpus griseus UAMH5409 TaxID=1447875 RepID=A0A2B7XYM8_9EURO|nr:hypothetical protein AJ79_03570 [Helicocarpus griseus UAMH5409]